MITMDANLQDDPAEIPKLLDTLEKEDVDLISGWKYPAKTRLKNVRSRLFLTVSLRCSQVSSSTT